MNDLNDNNNDPNSLRPSTTQKEKAFITTQTKTLGSGLQST